MILKKDDDLLYPPKLKKWVYKELLKHVVLKHHKKGWWKNTILIQARGGEFTPKKVPSLVFQSSF